MKFFAFDENIDRQMKMIQIRIRQLMNGEVAGQLATAGLSYQKMYGVSLVHLRQISQQYKPCNELAERLWYRNIREMMILATMVAQRDELSDEKLNEWSESITNIELAEQMAFNLLGKRGNSDGVLEKWLLSPKLYVRYTALMAIGWQFRFVGPVLSNLVGNQIDTLDAMGHDKRIVKAVAHCLKMAGRFNTELKTPVEKLARDWVQKSEVHLKAAGEEMLFELGSY
ncbi:DNA alkylation repair protein [Alkalitalea saponilacus]|uniref:3-methyladenine DNA glycosylase AlkD n=1 Tax=Alkalitalea saponilacus TaxID=889453 RepID=A0A1T5A8Y3_9BACT|nr:DNA alkylation repair protein [Alkalitalea saponilacus]ASB48806.1 hypothetical protein CDL62_06510 [Alkalitalea saponilacus]SKB31133.1 3-methyladenine DNA glycosylase AlkD [Alkalitalea saponilacus]